MTRPRILVGQIFQESHCFNPILTGRADFAIEWGEEALRKARGSGSTLGGILHRLDGAEVELVPTLAARARPGGIVEAAFYAEMKAAILEIAATGPIHGVAFELHGAMAAGECRDVEGDLMGAIRRTVGAKAVIGIGLDLHAHITDAMLSAVDFCIACKQNPHADVFETGERVASLVLDGLHGRVRPVSVVVKLPMIVSSNIETADHPLSTLHERARAWRAREPSILDISIFNIHNYLDASDAGQAVLAIADGDDGPATRAAMDLARDLWDWRTLFRSDHPSLDAVLERIAREPEGRPFVVADQGDRVLAGAPGDSTYILERLLARPAGLKAVIPVTDPDSVAAAKRAGLGAEIELRVGGRITPGFAPVALRGRVRNLSDGYFVQAGPLQAGQASTLGETAVIESGDVTLILTSVAGMWQDRAAFESQGIALADFDLIVVKSGYHFKLSFEGIATPVIAATPGLSAYRPGFFPFRDARPFYPEDPAAVPDFQPRVFPSRLMAGPRSAAYAIGAQIRGEVLGAYAARSSRNVDPLFQPILDYAIESCWGRVWSRDQLDRRSRSLLNLAMLTALDRPKELKLHVRGALNNGLTREEIAEVFVHAMPYCGLPAAIDAFTAAREVWEAGPDEAPAPR